MRIPLRNGPAVTRESSPAPGTSPPRADNGAAPAGLLASGSLEDTAFPAQPRLWHVRIRLAGYSCGASTRLAPAFPFHSRFRATRRPEAGRYQKRARPAIRQPATLPPPPHTGRPDPTPPD